MSLKYNANGKSLEHNGVFVAEFPSACLAQNAASQINGYETLIDGLLQLCDELHYGDAKDGILSLLKRVTGAA